MLVQSKQPTYLRPPPLPPLCPNYLVKWYPPQTPPIKHVNHPYLTPLETEGTGQQLLDLKTIPT